MKQLLDAIREGRFTEETLSLENQGLIPEQIIQLAQALKDNTYVKRLKLGCNQADDESAKALSELSLLELDLTANQIGTQGAEALACSSIKDLNLSGNFIGDEGARHFASSDIEHLSLDECGLTESGISYIILNKTLKTLSIANNNISSGYVLQFPENSHLEQLDLSQNGLSNENAFSLCNLQQLRVLDLDSNCIEDSGAQALASMRLNELFLSQNRITGQGLRYLFESKTIHKLGIPNNGIEFSESETLPDNTSLVEVNLTGNRLDDRCRNILQQLCSMQTIKTLDLAYNRIGSIGLEVLNEYCSHSLTVKLNGNPALKRPALEGMSERLAKNLRL